MKTEIKRSGRAVEGACLEDKWSLIWLVGSNPTSSEKEKIMSKPLSFVAYCFDCLDFITEDEIYEEVEGGFVVYKCKANRFGEDCGMEVMPFPSDDDHGELFEKVYKKRDVDLAFDSYSRRIKELENITKSLAVFSEKWAEMAGDDVLKRLSQKAYSILENKNE